MGSRPGEERQNLVRRCVLLCEGRADLLEDETADLTAIVLRRIGQGLGDPDTARTVLTLDCESEVTGLLQPVVRVGLTNLLGVGLRRSRP